MAELERSLHRFVVTPNCIKERIVRISGQDAKQISNVLRLEAGDRIAAVDGSGSAIIVSLSSVTSSLVTGHVVDTCRLDTEPKVKLTIAQSLPKGDKLEFIIQKGTELGAAGFEIITTARTIARPPDNRIEGRLARWRAIAKEAAEQSCRAIVPEITGIAGLSDIVGKIPAYDLVLCLWESEEETGIKDVLRETPAPESVLVVVGPEGGFEEEEVAMLAANGARAASLGNRVLRCETAAIAAAAVVIYELG